MTTSIELIYQPASAERELRDMIAETYWKGLAVKRWWPWPEVEVNLDVLGFFADPMESPTIMEIASRDPNAPRRYRFSLSFPRPVTGLLVAKPLYRLARHLRVRARDPLRPARVRRALGELNSSSPDLREARGEVARVPIVLVHGLGSTGAEMARMLEPLALEPSRYEHDTFMSIDANAQELAEALDREIR